MGADIAEFLNISIAAVWRSGRAALDFRRRRPGRAGAGTIAVTILFGPVNYFGANPKLTCH